jgi:hypothetical protein
MNAPWRGSSISVTDLTNTVHASPDLAGTDFTSTPSAIKDRPSEARPSADCPSEDRPQSRQFESFSLDCLKAGLRIRFQACGASMSPAIRDGEMVYVKPAAEAHFRKGDIVLVKNDHGFRLHRLIRADAGRDLFITRGDCGVQDDPAVKRDQILGVAVAKDVRLGTKLVRANFRGMSGRFLRTAARVQRVSNKLMGSVIPEKAHQPPRTKARPGLARPRFSSLAGRFYRFL